MRDHIRDLSPNPIHATFAMSRASPDDEVWRRLGLTEGERDTGGNAPVVADDEVPPEATERA